MIKILLPTDFSKASLNAIEYALDFASGSNVTLVFYHSFIPFDSVLAGAREKNREETIKVEQDLKNKIEKLKVKMNENFPDVAIETCIDKGAESREIISYSEKNKIDLIITEIDLQKLSGLEMIDAIKKIDHNPLWVTDLGASTTAF